MTNNPPPTRSTTHDDRLLALEVSNHSIWRQFDTQKEEFTKEFTNIKESMEALSNAIAQMGRKMERMDNQNSNFEEGSASRNQETNDFPQFSGEDPPGWIYEAENFLRYQRTADNEKVLLASFNLQDEALQWYQWFEKARRNVSWEEFTHALCVRFGPSDYEDFDEALAKLRQTGTVREYQAQFERIASRVHEWPEKALMGSYIGGLKDEIRSEVKLFHPTTLVHATSLARLQEEKLQRQRRALPQYGLLPTPPLRQTTEMQARREKGLCYNCDEKFVPGHKCKNQQVYMLETMLDSEEVEENEEAAARETQQTVPEISLHALSGVDTPQTMHVRGMIHGKPLHILIDSGSTHNFVNFKFSRKMGCCKVPAPAFRVMVVNGEQRRISLFKGRSLKE
ncbi:hypothetical protein ACB092_09G215900 [Castanea dentata]